MFYQLRNARLCAQVSDYGAKLTQLIVPNKDGERRDIVLGFATEEEWRTKETYFNAIIGRCANRIKDGRFTLDGKQYQLPVNNGTNSLHGGVHGFNEKTWTVQEHDDRHIAPPRNHGTTYDPGGACMQKGTEQIRSFAAGMGFISSR